TLALIASCGPAAEPVPEPSELWSDAGPDGGLDLPAAGLVLVVDKSGELVPATEDALVAAAAAARPFEDQLALAAIQDLDTGFVAAVNKGSLHYIHVETRDGQAPRLRYAGIPVEPALLQAAHVAGAWRDGERAVVFLRPSSDPAHGAPPAGVFLKVSADTADVWSPFPPGYTPTLPLLAVYPRHPDDLFFQTRGEDDERVQLAYGWTNGKTVSELGRDAFESAVQPRPLSEAPAWLHTLAGMLAGDLLVEVRGDDGGRQAYSRGLLEYAVPGQAQFKDGYYALVLEDGRCALATDPKQPVVVQLAAPVPGAGVRAACVSQSVLMALWEEDLFPLVGRTGAFFLDLDAALR
ncbi:MAG TPA: hypothetical protein PK625_04345, partial [Spirochaetales bacterium]|nr:hypothetical protein [Spirochaetales bacterium]